MMKNGCKNSLFLLVSFAVLSFGSYAYAAGYYLPGLGTRSFSRGAAYIVGGSEPTVMWTNVANIAKLKGLQVRADLEMVYLNFSYTRAPDNRHFTGTYDEDGRYIGAPPYRYKMPDDPDNPEWVPNTEEYPAVTKYKKVENEAPPFPVPLFMATYDFGLDNIVMAIGGYGPPRGSYELPEWGPQRYSLVDQSMWQAIIQLSFAGEFLDKRLRVGIGLQYIRSWFTQKIHLAAPPLELISNMAINDLSTEDYRNYDYHRTLDPNLDVIFEVSPVDDVSFGATAGIWLNPWKGLTLGGSVQTPTDLRPSGHFTSKIPKTYSNYLIEIYRYWGMEADKPLMDGIPVDSGADVVGDILDVYLNMPWIFRFGAGWEQNDSDGEPLFDAEVSFVYEKWSRHTGVEINPRDVVIQINPSSEVDMSAFGDPLGKLKQNVSLGTIIQTKKLQDAWSIRVGGDYHVLPGTLTVRAGYFFESSGIPDESYSVDLIDGDKHGFTTGLTFSRWGIDFDFGGGFIYLPERVITNSKRYAIDPISIALGIPGNENIPVANGTYNAYYIVASIGMTLHIDEWFGMHKGGKGLTKEKVEKEIIQPVKKNIEKLKKKILKEEDDEQREQNDGAEDAPQQEGGEQ